MRRRADSITPTQHGLVQSYDSEIAALPSGRFVTAESLDTDLPYVDLSHGLVRKFKSAGVLQREGERRFDDGSSRAVVWSVSTAVHERAQDAVSDGTHSPCGCGHSGIRNERGTDWYTCGNDGCDVRVTRAEVER